MTPLNLEHTDFQELTAIDITCKNCGSVIRLPLPKDGLPRSVACIGCNTQLWGYRSVGPGFEDDMFYADVSGIINVLSAYKRHVKESKFTIGFALPPVPASNDKG
jgi:hypothetical protein